MTHGSSTLAVVYRARNAAVVHALLDSLAAPESWEIRLWALDAPVESLLTWTVGTGAAPKFDLCNRLLAGAEQSEFTVVSDDDVSIAPGGIDRLIEYMSRAGLDLAQPAHTRSSISTYEFCRRRRWLQGRLTNFIEIGPLFAVGPRARQAIMPFPETAGMGWGLEFTWYDASIEHKLSIGIADCVPMTHLQPLGAHYDMASEGLKLQAEFDRRRVDSVESFQRTLGRHYRGIPAPRWRR